MQGCNRNKCPLCKIYLLLLSWWQLNLWDLPFWSFSGEMLLSPCQHVLPSVHLWHGSVSWHLTSLHMNESDIIPAKQTAEKAEHGMAES